MKSFKDIFRSHCEFDENGRHKNGTDRQSNHSYGDAYDYIFPDRESIRLVLEVGTSDGAGMRSWRDAFPNALIVGMDVHPANIQGERLEFHVGDQRNKAECERAAAGRQFDVIIEDAYHSTDNTLLTLFWLWPFVKPGGVYIVEEWQNVAGDMANVQHLFPGAEVVHTPGPFGGDEPLIVFRKA